MLLFTYMTILWLYALYSYSAVLLQCPVIIICDNVDLKYYMIIIWGRGLLVWRVFVRSTAGKLWAYIPDGVASSRMGNHLNFTFLASNLCHTYKTYSNQPFPPPTRYQPNDLCWSLNYNKIIIIIWGLSNLSLNIRPYA